MKKLKSLFVVPAVLALALAAALPLAEAHGNATANAMSANAAGASSTGTDSSSSSEPLTEDSLNQQTNTMMQSALAKHKNRQSDTARTRKCQAAKHGLETKLGNLQKNAAKHKALIDSIYSKALAYQQKNNLSPPNFSALVSTADAAQAKAAASVAVLDGLSVNLDCANTSVATNVASFKVAAKQTRDDLLAYRKAVIAVLQALESAKQ